MNRLFTELIDGSTITTDAANSKRTSFRTVHTHRGVSNEIGLWPTETEAREGHARKVREVTATIATGEDRDVVRH